MKISIKIFLALIITGVVSYLIKLALGGITVTGVFAIIFVSASVLSIMAIYFIEKPVKKLKNTIEEISKGKLDTKIDPSLIKHKDEIGDLARAFDRILVSLKIAADMVGISKEKLKLGEMIQGKKETEIKLKTTQEFLTNMLENAGIPVIAFDKKGEILLANKKFTEVTGYRGEDVANIDRFIAAAFPAKMASDKFIKSIEQFHKGEEIDNLVIPIMCKNKTTIIVVGSIAQIKDEKGDPNGEAVFMRDLSEIFSLEKDIRYWAANGFVQENQADHRHEIEISKTRGAESGKKSKNRNKRIR